MGVINVNYFAMLIKLLLIEVHLAGRAGQSHSSLKLCQYLLLQNVQLVPPGSSVQFITPTVDQVIVDVEQGLIVHLNDHMLT